jgi:hypothetical protein
LLNWSSTSRLTFDANTNLNVQAPITVAGSRALTLTYSDGGLNGDLIFSNGGNATFSNLSSSLVINGNGYTLVDTLGALAGAVEVEHSGLFALSSDYDASGDGIYSKSVVENTLSGTFEGLGHSM